MSHRKPDLDSPIIRFINCQKPNITTQYKLGTGSVPVEWKQANVTPVNKKGVKTDISNCRPVSVLLMVAKVFEKVVH